MTDCGTPSPGHELATINFHGAELDAIHEPATGDVHVNIRRVCEALGIDTDTQRKKLRGKAWATCKVFKTLQGGQFRDVSFLHVDALPMWLATIDLGRVAGSAVARLEIFQCEAAAALRDHFLGAAAPAPAGLDAKERRLMERERRLSRQLEADERKFKVQLLRDTAERLGGQLTDDAIQTLYIAALELGIGRKFPVLAPSAKGVDDWFSPTQMAESLGVSPQRVGLTITALDLRGDKEGISRSAHTTTKGGAKQVVTYHYSPKAVIMVAAHLRGAGHLSASRTAIEVAIMDDEGSLDLH